MSEAGPGNAAAGKGDDHVILRLTRQQRFRFYTWGAIALVLSFLLWALLFLRLDRWHTYTDQVYFEQVARDVDLGYVLWQAAEPAASGIAPADHVATPVVSSTGARMVYSAGREDGNANLFLREWDGREWQAPRPLRALNSAFHETAPALSGDGNLLYFASDRPGGRGGSDIWVAKWDGAEYAWPLPLTGRVNTPFDEVDPAPAPDNFGIYFASNRPRRAPGTSEAVAELLENVEERKGDFDLYQADAATETALDLIVERRLSMLYSLREGALANQDVMAKLGGTPETEAAVDRSLAYLASTQEDDGRWDIRRSGGQGGHDVAATAFALLAFYGRGEVHDEECQYRDHVKRGIEWLVAQQNPASGDLRGERPQRNAMYDHGIAALAVVEAYGVTKDSTLRPKAQAALDFIAESQHEEGGWRYQPNERGDLSVSGWMIMALASAEMSGLRVDEETVAGARRFLDHVRSGQHGGNYGYTGPGRGTYAMNAAGFFCSQLLGASPNTSRAYESAATIDRQGFNLNDVYYAYYGTLAAYQHQGPGWRKWLARMQTAFLGTQARDGSWQFRGGHGSAMGRVIGTALVTLCLEAHYRYTPLYGLGWEPHPDGPSGESQELTELAATPLFRHARVLSDLSSPADDLAPVVTDHGDFLYFASDRAGGLGGSDLYRTRLQTPDGPRNLGPEINSPANETNPALRNAGFHLLFNSDRNENANELFSARSVRVEKRYDWFRLPGLRWIIANAGWFLALFVTLAGAGWFGKRALKPNRTPTLATTEPASDGLKTEL